MVIWLAWQNPEKGFIWQDFVGLFLCCLMLGVILIGLALRFFRQRMRGDPVDLRSAHEDGE